MNQRSRRRNRRSGYQAIAIRCDVADEQSVKAAVEQVVATYGRLDAAFNNAGIQSPAVELADVTGEVYDSVLSINLRGVWNFMKYELQQMRKQGSGAIVNNSSLGGLVGVPGRAAYHASKHGIIGLTKSAALEYATRGRINTRFAPELLQHRWLNICWKVRPVRWKK
jgi:NAD(P)-dependent dehydrogenase (short-subunit alcohol dehydrogenase family)